MRLFFTVGFIFSKLNSHRFTDFFNQNSFFDIRFFIETVHVIPQSVPYGAINNQHFKPAE